MSVLNYVGPYSPEAYNAAQIIADGGTGTPYTAPIIDAGNAIISAQSNSGGASAPTPAAPAYDANLLSGFNTQKGAITGSANAAIETSGNQLKSNILDYLDSYKQAQSNIDRQGVQAELARKSGARGILDMVGNGIRSGGVMLANRNASTSSAADALARAYGMMGREQMTNVGNQYAQTMSGLDQQQSDLQTGIGQQQRHYDENKVNIINNIVSDAQTKLAALDAAMANASMPDRINLEAEKQAIRDQAVGHLQQFDTLLSSGVSAIHPSSVTARQGEATNLLNSGVAPETAYNYTSSVPAELQNTGSFASSLPIFTFPSAKKQTA